MIESWNDDNGQTSQVAIFEAHPLLDRECTLQIEVFRRGPPACFSREDAFATPLA